METSDKLLLEAIANKDEKAFNVFYKRYASLLYKWALNRIGNPYVANDIAQDFWSNLWLNPHSIKTNDTGSAKNFLLHFYTFRILDYLRAPSNKVKTVDSEEELTSLQNTLSYSHILEEIEEKEIHSLIDKVIEGLPELTRDIFVHRWKEQHSIKETASHFEVDEKTVYNRTFVALTAIRIKVKEMLTDTSTISDPKTLLKLVILLNLLER